MRVLCSSYIVYPDTSSLMYRAGSDTDSDTSSTISDSDSDSDDIAEGITALAVGGKVVDISNGTTSTAVVHASGLRNIQIGHGRCVIVGSSHKKQRQRGHKVKHYSPTRHRSPELTGSKRTPSKHDISYICDNIGKHWRKLALSLGLSRGVVEGIEVDFGIEGHYEMAYQALLKWTRQHGERARLCDLARALHDIGQTELAEELPV